MQKISSSMKGWAKDDLPREKLKKFNPSALSDSELLAVLIGHGTKNKNALELARELLQRSQNNLNHLGRINLYEIMKIKGIGEAKANTIIAAMELGRRRQASLALDKRMVKGSRDIANYLRALLQDLPYEVFAVVFLNRANRINHFEIVSEGGLTGTIADPRIILKKALEHNAVSLILCHNHPSGDLRPSHADEELTQKIKRGAMYLEISILDHIIVSESGYFSFSDDGIL